MLRRPSRSNAIVAALKSMVGGQQSLSGSMLRGRNNRQYRAQRCAVQTEVCESRVVLSAQYVPNHVLLGLDKANESPGDMVTDVQTSIPAQMWNLWERTASFW